METSLHTHWGNHVYIRRTVVPRDQWRIKFYSAVNKQTSEVEHEASAWSCVNCVCVCTHSCSNISEWISSINNSIPSRLQSPFLISSQLRLIYGAATRAEVLHFRRATWFLHVWFPLTTTMNTRVPFFYGAWSLKHVIQQYATSSQVNWADTSQAALLASCPLL